MFERSAHPGHDSVALRCAQATGLQDKAVQARVSHEPHADVEGVAHKPDSFNKISMGWNVVRS